MDSVRSADGTPIAFDRTGRGPAVVLVAGATADRQGNASLAEELARGFTVLNYDRRGRGDSGDTLPYSVAREIEDIGALIDAAGGTAHLYGISSGGALVLEAAAAGVPADRVAVYEVPYNMDENGPREQEQYVGELSALLADGRRGEAMELFMRVAGTPEEMIAGAKASPMWPAMEAVAPTLAYDAACMGNGHPPTERLARIGRPTLVATGGASGESSLGGGGSFFDRAADAVAAAIPRAERAVVPGQTHMVDPKVLAPVLEEFYERG